MSRSDRRQREIAARWILIDLERWQNAHNRRTCEAIWNLPAPQPNRKENNR
ncbi:hypothetical protein [Streptomyces sp. NPDC126503]|uniref:hypothetical protein n=1 Tax=Streptomyces sp. NPDC126503 TaxID=3155315 RepID=UPI0033333BC6